MRGLKVLIVDDEPLMRLSMLDALEAVGCEVTAAATGTEGLVILGTRQFDIVITDLRLPGGGWAYNFEGIQRTKSHDRGDLDYRAWVGRYGRRRNQFGRIRLYYQTFSDGRVAADRRARRENYRATT